MGGEEERKEIKTPPAGISPCGRFAFVFKSRYNPHYEKLGDEQGESIQRRIPPLEEG